MPVMTARQKNIWGAASLFAETISFIGYVTLFIVWRTGPMLQHFSDFFRPVTNIFVWAMVFAFFIGIAGAIKDDNKAKAAAALGLLIPEMVVMGLLAGSN